MKILHCFAALFLSATLLAGNVELIVEKVENGGLVPGNTYRVWAKLADSSQSLHLIWGDDTDPLTISSTAPFYQHQLGTQTSVGMNEFVILVYPELAYDSYVTVGYDRSLGNGLWELGIDFAPFNQGQSITTTNGAWFLQPTDIKCQPQANGLVLIGQFTTTGIASGTMNIQGWNAPQDEWQERGVTFTTSDAKVFGCMDDGAANYNSLATFDDASCEGIAASIPLVLSGGKNSWEIFPNPIRESLIHIQFNDIRVFDSGKARIDIFDLSGKLVATHSFSPESLQKGNRMTLEQELAQGTYKVVLSGSGKPETKTVVVQR